MNFGKFEDKKNCICVIRSEIMNFGLLELQDLIGMYISSFKVRGKILVINYFRQKLVYCLN